jgi:hypothetical protein
MPEPVAPADVDIAVAEAPLAEDLVEQPAPRKRGRPRKVVAPA